MTSMKGVLAVPASPVARLFVRVFSVIVLGVAAACGGSQPPAAGGPPGGGMPPPGGPPAAGGWLPPHAAATPRTITEKTRTNSRATGDAGTARTPFIEVMKHSDSL
jgi:hypothetical protein